MADEFDQMSDEELAAFISQGESDTTTQTTEPTKSSEPNEFSHMSDEELAKMISQPDGQQPSEKKMSIGEKFSRAILPPDFVESTDEFAASPESEGLKATERAKRTVDQFGQSMMLGNVAGQILSKVPSLAQLKTPDVGLRASDATKAAYKAVKNQNVQRAIQRLAVEGAVAAQPFDYKDLEDRIKGTALFAVLAPTIGMSASKTMDTAISLGRKISKVKFRLQTPARETIAGGLRDPRKPALKSVKEQAAKAQKESSQMTSGAMKQLNAQKAIEKEQLGALEGRKSVEVQKIEKSIKEQQAVVNKSMDETAKQINKASDDLEKSLNKEANINANTFQDKANKFYSENGKAYGDKLDVVSDGMAKQGRSSLGEADAVLARAEKIIAENTSLAGTPLAQEISALRANKYGPKEPLSARAQADLDALPESIRAQVAQQSETLRDQAKLIPFKEVLTDLRSIWRKAYQGNRMTNEGRAGAILQSEFGEWVSVLPGGEKFQALQASYRPIMSWMNKLSIVMKQNQGPAFVDQAERLIRKIAYDPIKSGEAQALGVEKDLIQFIEKGTEHFSKGVGNVTGRARQMGENLKVLKDQLGKSKAFSERRIAEIAEEGARKISKINAHAKNAGKNIERLSRETEGKIQMEVAKRENQLWERTRDLGFRETTITAAKSQMTLFKKLAFGVITAVGGLTTFYVASRGAGQLLDVLAEGK
jgi:hypothetical protein